MPGLSLLSLAVMLIFSACQSARYGDSPQPLTAEPSVTIKQLQADEAAARTEEEVREILRGYEAFPPESPYYPEAQTGAARLQLLLGAAFSTKGRVQRQLYRSARQSAAKALQADPAVRARVEAGLSVPQAAAVAQKASFEALFLWSTAIFYHFRDVASFPERILFSRQLLEAKDALEVIRSKDPEWGEGIVPFSLGIYYLSVPGFLGGDRARARNYMDEAVSMSNQRLLPRWGRAKYLAVAIGDPELFLQDLEWVIDQNPSQMKGPLVWNLYFQKDACNLLANGWQ